MKSILKMTPSLLLFKSSMCIGISSIRCFGRRGLVLSGGRGFGIALDLLDIQLSSMVDLVITSGLLEGWGYPLSFPLSASSVYSQG